MCEDTHRRPTQGPKLEALNLSQTKVILRLSWGYIGMMEKKMEITI